VRAAASKAAPGTCASLLAQGPGKECHILIVAQVEQSLRVAVVVVARCCCALLAWLLFLFLLWLQLLRRLQLRARLSRRGGGCQLEIEKIRAREL